jgi:NADH:ubiquinone oxidoreductase subunit 4 (subunit M)
MVFMGVYPRPFLDRSKETIVAIQQQLTHQAGGSVETAENK